MKKISFFTALLVLMGISMTSCKEDTQPRIEVPTEFELYRPAMADNTYVLTPEGSVEFAVSQANYGLGLNAKYTVQVSLDDEWKENVPVVDADGNAVLDENGNPTVKNTYETLIGKYTTAKFSVPAEDIAVAMCRLLGFTEEDQFVPGAHPLYVRVVSSVPNWAEGTITSNVIKLNSVAPYFKLRVPGVIYLIGASQGWDIDNGSMPLSETEDGIGSQVYYGVYNISAEDAAGGFRFYTALGAWGDNGALPSVGANPKDGDNKTVEVDEEGNYEGDCKAGKGNWSISNWPGGDMKITVDLAKMKVYFQKVAAEE